MAPEYIIQPTFLYKPHVKSVENHAVIEKSGTPDSRQGRLSIIQQATGRC